VKRHSTQCLTCQHRELAAIGSALLARAIAAGAPWPRRRRASSMCRRILCSPVASYRSREAWCDTTTDVGRLMLTIMGGIAEFERGLIRKRRIERARRKGTKFGRPTALDEGEKRTIAERYAKGATIPELAAEYECGVGTIWRSLQSAKASTWQVSPTLAPQELGR
jgi:resolvase-like protein